MRPTRTASRHIAGSYFFVPLAVIAVAIVVLGVVQAIQQFAALAAATTPGAAAAANAATAATNAAATAATNAATDAAANGGAIAAQIAAATAPADFLYLAALFISTALVTDFRLPVGRLSNLPSVSTAVALLATANLGDQLFVSLAVWILGFFCGALFNSRDIIVSVYASGLAALGALGWSLVMRIPAPVGPATILLAVGATIVYLVIVLSVEFARQRGRWGRDATFGLDELSLRRLLVILVFIAGLSAVLSFGYMTIYPLLVAAEQNHRGAIMLLIVAAVIFAFARLRQLHGLQRRLRGLTDAALTLPWTDPASLSPADAGWSAPVTDSGADHLASILKQRAHQAVSADGIEIRTDPPGANEIGFVVRLAPDAQGFVVATRELGGAPFTREDERVLEALAHLATEAARVTEDMADLTLRANSDSLTSLPNYIAFRQALVAANENRPYSGAIAVLFIDLDSFKKLNDRHGHHVGDVMLVTVAERLKATARPHDIVARVGGDEFVVILTALKSLAEAKQLAEHITAQTSAPFVVDETPPIELRPLLSVGLAYSAHRETDPSALVIDADRSMLAVKKSRHQGGPAAESTINISPHRSARINDIVAGAIDDERLSVAFQPIVNMAENRIWAFEALVRYTDPELGAISPGALVERAKSLGRMDQLTRQVMAKAMSGARAIQLIEPTISTIAVNLEVGQITDDHVGAFAKEIAGRYPTISLCLELNERSLRHVTDDLRAQAQVLRDLGIIIALDDYGSENSSVGSLVRIPMDILKLDRSLIDDTGDIRQREVVKALQGFSDALDYLTIVEGIESAATADVLRGVGVRNAQGFYYGVPSTYEQTIARLSRHGTAAVVS
ncbi:putative bifunctional diguanylate cyclase/phosphodiesterase [Subtercola sp. YIM 133946]|uniref:putative bifunctional diguanylate cyclase/phosphodiesterase n=1 Tax=Subtercola sp. YIM 133946 TaxID=3118909 RepID=UPI002F92AE81